MFSGQIFVIKSLYIITQITTSSDHNIFVYMKPTVSGALVFWRINEKFFFLLSLNKFWWLLASVRDWTMSETMTAKETFANFDKFKIQQEARRKGENNSITNEKYLWHFCLIYFGTVNSEQYKLYSFQNIIEYSILKCDNRWKLFLTK